VKLLAVFLSVLALAGASSVHAQKTFIIGAQDIAYLPHYDFNNEQEKGAVWRILEAYGSQNGLTFEYVALPIKRLHKELLAGNVDFVFPDNPKWFNQQFKGVEKHFSAPFYEILGASFVHRNDYNLHLDKVSSLSVPSGFSPIFWQSRIDDGQILLVDATNAIAAMRLVLSKRAQVTDLEYSVVQWHKRDYPEFTDICISPYLPHDVVALHLTTVNHPEIIHDLNRFLQENPQHLEQIKQQYGIVDARKLASDLFRMRVE